MIETFLT